MGATTLVLDHIVRYIRAYAGPALTAEPGSTEIALDTATGTLKFGVGATTKEVADLSTAQTVTGAKTFTGAATFTGATTGLRRAVSVTAADTIAITAAMSGTVFVATKASATQVFTLPAAATAGLEYTFVCGTGGIASEIHVGVFAGDLITGKIHAAENGTALLSTVTTGLLKNTAATNVDGDFCTLVSDGVTTWYMVALAGVWSAT
jgi:hypothetical protein